MIMNGHVVFLFLVRLLPNFLMRFLLWWLVVQKDIIYNRLRKSDDFFVFNFAFHFNLIFAGVFFLWYKKSNWLKPAKSVWKRLRPLDHPDSWLWVFQCAKSLFKLSSVWTHLRMVRYSWQRKHMVSNDTSISLMRVACKF